MDSTRSTRGECPAADTIALFSTGQLPANQASQIEKHLQGCVVCAAAVGASRSTNRGELTESSQTCADPVGTRHPAEVDRPPVHLLAGRYRLGDVIAVGGMGKIYKAIDIVFEREVAIKRLLHTNHGDSTLAERFRKEALLTARLQHPGIPPMYDFGLAADGGEPFLAMKLVAGRTLTELLKERKSPQDDLQRFLSIFEQIARAVGYAHWQKVIHRDLKPANVMVGEFGETQVMDWGIAKALGGTDTQSAAREIAGSPDERTLDGAVMGTPAYMPPEQARGEISRLDARTDVFALGVILLKILEGGNVYEGQNYITILASAAAGDVTPAIERLRRANVDAGLVSITEACLSPDPSGRPADGAAVADLVANHRGAVEARLRAAETAAAEARVREAERTKRRRVFVGSTAIVIVALAAGATVTTIQRNRAVVAEKATGKQLEKTKEAEAKTAEQLLVAQRNARTALDAFGELASNTQAGLAGRAGTRTLARQLIAQAREGVAKIRDNVASHDNPDSTLVWAHLRLGQIELGSGDTEKALVEFRAAERLARRVRDADLNNPEKRLDLGAALSSLGKASLEQGHTEEALRFFEEDTQLCDALVGEFPNDERVQRDLSVALNHRGDALVRMGRSDDAMQSFRRSLDMRRDFVVARPDSRQALRDLGTSLERVAMIHEASGNVGVALLGYQEMLEIKRRVAERDPEDDVARREVAVAWEHLGDIHLASGKVEDASQMFEKDVSISRELAKNDPSDDEKQRDLATALVKLGDALAALDRNADALKLFQEGLDLRRAAARLDAVNVAKRRALSVALSRTGVCLFYLGRTDEAIAAFEEDLEMSRALAEIDKTDVEAQWGFVASCHQLAVVESSRHNHAAAAERLSQAKGTLAALHERGLLVGKRKDALARLEHELAECRDAVRAEEDVEFVFAHPPETLAKAAAQRIRTLLYRRRTADALATADRFATWAETQTSDPQGNRYNAACLLALCAAGETIDQPTLTRSLALLQQLKEGGYFDESKTAHFRQDSDFAGVRTATAFQEFDRSLAPPPAEPSP
jgi:tetratricopeptide (TPR) repeat protein/tRNA A-37 threonylcarbamoyl transferase component Bud32